MPPSNSHHHISGLLLLIPSLRAQRPSSCSLPLSPLFFKSLLWLGLSPGCYIYPDILGNEGCGLFRNPITLCMTAIHPNEAPLWAWKPTFLLQGPIRGHAPFSCFSTHLPLSFLSCNNPHPLSSRNFPLWSKNSHRVWIKKFSLFQEAKRKHWLQWTTLNKRVT